MGEIPPKTQKARESTSAAVAVEIKSCKPALSRKEACQACCVRTCDKPKKYMWDDRTHIERCLWITLAIALLFVLCLSIAVHVLSKRDVSQYCVTPDCVNTASFILSSLDKDYDPCQNFYHFSCGQVLQDSLVFPGSDKINVLTRAQKAFEGRVQSILETKNQSMPPALEKAIIYYNSCMDEPKIAAQGVRPLQDVIHRVFENDDWIEILRRMAGEGLDTNLFFNLAVIPDESGASNIFSLMPTNIDFPPGKTFGRNDTSLIDYHHFMVNMSLAVGFLTNRDQAEAEFQEVWKMEYDIFQISGSDESLQPLRVADLQKEISHINWHDYFKAVVPDMNVDNYLVQINDKSKVQQILDKITNTDSARRTVTKNYMFWHICRSNLKYLNFNDKELIAKSETKASYLFPSPRIIGCSRQVWESMLSPAAAYVKKYLPGVKPKAQEIFSGVKDELVKVLSSRYDVSTKMGEIIGKASIFVFSDELLDDDKLKDFYAELSFDVDQYFENVMKLSKLRRRAEMKKIAHSPNSPPWSSIIYPWENEYTQTPDMSELVQIPFTFLSGLNFYHERLEFANYATLGPLIGLSLLSKIIFLDDGKTIVFGKESCNIGSLSNPIIDKIGVDQTNPRSSIVALKMAYRAYKGKYTEDKFLPGLKYSPQQMFWIVDAAFICGSYESKYKFQRDTETRINEAFASLSEFYTDFQCPSNSFMKRPNQCPIWQ